MWIDQHSLRAMTFPCTCCGKTGDVYYWIQFYILPHRLLRKRHRERKQDVRYCRSCFEKNENLPILFDDRCVTIPKTPRGDLEDMGWFPCFHCGKRVIDNKGLYGFLASTFVVGGSLIENAPLAYLCAACVEDHTIRFLATI